jgi:hypothetical protein
MSSAFKPSTSAAVSLRLEEVMAGKKATPESLQKNLEWLANFIVLSPFLICCTTASIPMTHTKI